MKHAFAIDKEYGIIAAQAKIVDFAAWAPILYPTVAFSNGGIAACGYGIIAVTTKCSIWWITTTANFFHVILRGSEEFEKQAATRKFIITEKNNGILFAFSRP